MCFNSANTTNTSQTNTPAGAKYVKPVEQRLSSVANLPYTPVTQGVAGLTPEQQLAMGNVNTAYGNVSPYYADAARLFDQGSQPLTADQINQYYNPMSAAVTAQMQNIFGQQQRQATASAQGAAGGIGADRVGVAQGNLANQQGLAAGQTYAGLWQNALQAAQAEQQTQLAAGAGFGNLAGQQLQGQLSAAGAQFGMGTTEQMTEQQALNATYNQQMQQQAFPYQQASFWAQNAYPGAGLMGGQTTGTYTPPQPSPFSQAAGLGIAALGMFAKDGGAVKGYDVGGAPASGVGPYTIGGLPYGGSGGYIPMSQMPTNMSAPQSSYDPMLQQGMMLNNQGGGGMFGGMAGMGSNLSQYGKAGQGMGTLFNMGNAYMTGNTGLAAANPDTWLMSKDGGPIHKDVAGAVTGDFSGGDTGSWDDPGIVGDFNPLIPRFRGIPISDKYQSRLEPNQPDTSPPPPPPVLANTTTQGETGPMSTAAQVADAGPTPGVATTGEVPYQWSKNALAPDPDIPGATDNSNGAATVGSVAATPDGKQKVYGPAPGEDTGQHPQGGPFQRLRGMFGGNQPAGPDPTAGMSPQDRILYNLSQPYQPTIFGHPYNPGMVAAGLGMMSQTSPYGLSNVGKGGMEGMEYNRQIYQMQNEAQARAMQSYLESERVGIANQQLGLSQFDKVENAFRRADQYELTSGDKTGADHLRQIAYSQAISSGMSADDVNKVASNKPPQSTTDPGYPKEQEGRQLVPIEGTPYKVSLPNGADPTRATDWRANVPQNVDALWNPNGELVPKPQQKAIADRAKTILDPVQKQYQSAIDGQNLLDQMGAHIHEQAVTGGLSPGTLQDESMSAVRAYDSLKAKLGFDIDPSLRDQMSKVGNLEALKKLQTQLGFSLARTLGTREAMQVIQQALGAVPGLGMSLAGQLQVYYGLRSAQDRALDKGNFMQEWQSRSHFGSLDKAQDFFDNAVGKSENYVNRALDMQKADFARMTGQLKPGTDAYNKAKEYLTNKLGGAQYATEAGFQ